ncbi:MAG: hypothetical protein QOJ69_2024 [Actinomycetota bacterium]|jgi:hypothetical protein|nr:hypothetical protein [Actinomycetota bacterium]
MYHFAVVALLGLAILKIADVLVDLVPSLGKTRTLLTFVLAIATTVVLDYSLFAGFGIGLREAWMGTVATGLVAGSLATAWSAVFAWLGVTEDRTTEDTRSTRRHRIAA